MRKDEQEQRPGGKGEVLLQVNGVLFTFHLEVTAAKRESEKSTLCIGGERSDVGALY